MLKFILKGTRQLTLPVTPESFKVFYGCRVETINIHAVGDVNLVGAMELGTIQIKCMFPMRNYPFALDSGDPYSYVEQIQGLIKKKKPIRFIVTGTPINERVLAESITYGEQDGTRDVYAEITLRGYRAVSAPQMAQAPTTRPPVDNAPTAVEQSYAAVYGDTLCGICRKYYGDGTYALAKKLATYNGRPDPNILYVGEVLRIPPRAALGG